MRFVKAHGAGNDFVLLPDLDDRLALSADLVVALCDRHTGVGADGVIRVAPARPGVDADVFMDYRNADGSVVEMCGNGVRCVAKYVADRGLTGGDTVRVDSRAGVKPVTVTGRDGDGLVTAVRVDMSPPVPGDVDAELDVDGRKVRVTTLSMGNPHAVLLVDDVAAAPVADLGPRIERHPAFPQGTNVEFISVPARDHVVGRIWERGVGETLASGTGGSAMAAAAHLLGPADRTGRVSLPGGDLAVDWTDETLTVTGPAVEVADGTIDDGWLRASGALATSAI
jgi:diaminopimelate epimerase